MIMTATNTPSRAHILSFTVIGTFNPVTLGD